MGLINEKDAEQLGKVFAVLPKPVQLVMFTQENECDFCATTRQIVEELAALGEKLTAEVLDFVADRERAAALRIDKIPAIAVLSDGQDTRMRFFGVPAGYEFTTLVEDILDAGRGAPELPDPVAKALAKIDQPVHLQVAVSPTCPYCPAAVRAAHKLALANEHVRADMLEMTEFPYLAVKYGVQGVPHTIINEEHSLVGAVSELELVEEITKILGK
jgi:glutaredoxin-like protein